MKPVRSRILRLQRSCACLPSSYIAPVRYTLFIPVPCSIADDVSLISSLTVLAEDAIKAAIKDYRKKRAASLASAASLQEDVAAANARSEISA